MTSSAAAPYLQEAKSALLKALKIAEREQPAALVRQLETVIAKLETYQHRANQRSKA